MKSTYRTFKRTCRNFDQYQSAQKRTVETGLTVQEARASCENFNKNRSDAQVRARTKLELKESNGLRFQTS